MNRLARVWESMPPSLKALFASVGIVGGAALVVCIAFLMRPYSLALLPLGIAYMACYAVYRE